MVTGKPLYTVKQIQDKVTELAERISRDYEGKDLMVISILKGAFAFTADLVKAIRTPLSLDFIAASSYVKVSSSGKVEVYCDVKGDVAGRDVLLVEDIVDTGVTLDHVVTTLKKRNPRSIKICCLLNKKERRKIDVPLDYVGFNIPDVYVVGYGLDYDDRFRNLPYIAVFKESV